MDGVPPLLMDSLVNLTSNLGTEKDKGTAARFTPRVSLSRGEIEALYRHNWLGGKVIDIPADDAVREWRAWNANVAGIEALEEAERVLGVREKVNAALKLAAKDGGSAILIGTGEMPDQPLVPARVPKGGIRFLKVVSRYDLATEPLELDPTLPWFGQPKAYRLSIPGAPDMAIHPSRVVPFYAGPRASAWSTGEVWGSSVFERLHDPIRDATASMQSAASMMQEAKVDVIKIPGLTENVPRPEYRAAVTQRFGLAMALKSLNNTLLLDAAEEWEQKTLTFQGVPEMIEKQLSVVAGAADMPVTRLLGRSATGLNATGQADLEAYYTMVRSRQEMSLRPTLSWLDEALIRHAMGRKPRGIYYEFRSLWSLPATDQAEIALKQAQAIAAIAKALLFAPEALREAVLNQFEEASFLPGLREALKASPDVPEPPQPPSGVRPIADDR